MARRSCLYASPLHRRRDPSSGRASSIDIGQGCTTLHQLHSDFAPERLRPGVEAERAHAFIQMNLAWVLATAPEERLRDGELAFRLANQVCQATGFEHARAVDVLAAALADVGRFEEAVQMTERSLTLFGPVQTPFRKDVEMRRSLYEQRRPYRLPAAQR